jgi:hypothetical protein
MTNQTILSMVDQDHHADYQRKRQSWVARWLYWVFDVRQELRCRSTTVTSRWSLARPGDVEEVALSVVESHSVLPVI